MADNVSKYNWMAGLFGPDLWDMPVEGAETAPHDASREAGASQWELNRHMNTVHGRRKDFLCPYPGCYQGSQPSASARPDKLTSHINACHGRDQEVHIKCPAVGCLEPVRKLTDIAEHIRNDHLVDGNKRKQAARCGDEVKILRAVANAAPAGGEE